MLGFQTAEGKALNVLVEQDLFALEDKVATAIKRIRQFCAGKRVLVAFSGGKDSQACYHLCKDAGVPFHAEMSVTRFEPPEQIAFIREHYPDCTFRRAYKMLLVDEIEYRGLPNRWARWCCDCKHVKTDGYDISLVGVRAQESPARRASWRMFGQKPDKTWYLCPVFDWTADDVWAYLNSRGIPHCSLYDEGFKRVGCVCCPLAATRKRRDWERWPKTARMLYLGFLKHWRKAEANGFLTSTGKKMHLAEWACPRDAFVQWLRTGSVRKDYKPEMGNIPCVFEGTGFSEADAIENQAEDV